MGKPTMSSKSVASRERVRKHREALRAKDLKPVTRWLPDTSSPEFQAEYEKHRKVIADYARAHPEEEAQYSKWAEALQCDEGLLSSVETSSP